MSKSERFTIELLQRKGFVVEGSKAVKQNKIANAQKVEIDGEKFASKLELYFYNLLKSVNIPFLFQVEYVLQDGFKFHGAAIRPIKIIVDFYLEEYDLIIDTKGWQLADSKIKYKMLKRKLFKEGKQTEIEMPKNKEECEALINRLLKKRKSKP